MIAAPVLITPRLILRPPIAEDLDGFADFYADPESTQFIGGPRSRAESWRFLCAYAGAFALTGVSMFSVIERSSGRWLGRIGPWAPEGWPGTEVGWGLRRDAEGQGFALEAAAAAIDYAFDVLGWTDVIHTIAPDNAASIALARRLGSTMRGPTRLPPPFADLPVDAWGQSAEQWRLSRPAAGQAARLEGSAG